jgi:hypothetical protein
MLECAISCYKMRAYRTPHKVSPIHVFLCFLGLLVILPKRSRHGNYLYKLKRFFVKYASGNTHDELHKGKWFRSSCVVVLRDVYVLDCAVAFEGTAKFVGDSPCVSCDRAQAYKAAQRFPSTRKKTSLANNIIH